MDELARLLAETQRSEQDPREQAERDLKQAYANPSFPLLLTAIASTGSYPTGIRQAALTVLRTFIVHNWSDDGEDSEDDDDDEPRFPIQDDVKQELRAKLLELATRDQDDRRVKSSVSYVIGKIANVDFPDRWPNLLDNILAVIREGTDMQLHGALRVLSDLVDNSLSFSQFFSAARTIVEVLYQVALNGNRKASLRALAVSAFRSSFDLMEMVKAEHPTEVKNFANEALQGWLPFFHDVLKMQLPERAPGHAQQSDGWNGLVALKLQAVKTLIRIKSVFPSLLLPQCFAFFEETWSELSSLRSAYKEQYIDNNSQGRLEDSDGLPYTLDFLVLEELDLLNQCLRAPPVQKELERQLQTSASAYETRWMIELMGLVVVYSCITQEEEELWDIDISLYLSEETSVTTNYTARTACGDLLIKLAEWIGQKALEGLFAHSRTLFASETGDWRSQEAALYLFNMLVSDLMDLEKTVPAEICQVYLQLVEFAIAQPGSPLLQARGYLVGGLLAQCYTPAIQLFDRAIIAISQATSELVQVACVKAIEGFIKSNQASPDRQVPIIQAIEGFINSKDLTDLEGADDLLVTLAETLRAAINMNKAIVIASDIKSLDLLFTIARHGATNFQVTMLANEAFEDVVRALSDSTSYAALCAKVIPTLNGFFSYSDMTKDEPLITLATELIAVLVQYGSEPLPAGFIAQITPKLKALLMESSEGEVLRPGAEALKYMLMHDHHQVFEWHDEQGNNGLVVCLQIIDRLLGPAIEDNSASEVGGLAAELVEKAGHQRLGDGMLERLLQVVAIRLTTAQTAPFIQSLILIYARLCLNAASEVVQFLSQITISTSEGQENGLKVVLGKWLENSISFAGYDEIRQNVIALSKLYALNDSRIAQTQVKGDMILPSSDMIMTRSRAKQNPDRFTIVPAPLKILKVLIEELLSAQGKLGTAAANAAAAIAADFDAVEGEGDEGWEDDPDSLDLSLGATGADLMAYMESGSSRMRDDETQAYLTEFFLRAARDNTAGFKGWYDQLTDEEKGKLNELAAQ